MRLSRVLCVLLVVLVAAGCVYPRRHTSLAPVRRQVQGLNAPDGIWRVTLLRALIPARGRGDLPWDPSGDGPDAYVKIFRNDELIFESRTISDSTRPEWNQELPRNLSVPENARMRFEVWDDDDVGADPIGIYRVVGLPQNAVPGADARLLLDTGAYLVIRVDNPRPHRGLGVSQYEVRGDTLHVVEVLPHSPASRADLRPGDDVVQIGDDTVSALGSARSASAFSMSVYRQVPITVRRGEREVVIEPDRGYVWLTM